MVSKIFLDTNIFMDHLLSRNSHSTELIRYCEVQDVSLFASSATFFALAYFVGKYSDRDVKEVLLEYSEIVDLIPTTRENIYAAYGSNFKDLEDGFQFFTAQNEPGMDFFVTNNVKDFKNVSSKFKIVTPENLLKLLSDEE